MVKISLIVNNSFVYRWVGGIWMIKVDFGFLIMLLNLAALGVIGYALFLLIKLIKVTLESKKEGKE